MPKLITRENIYPHLLEKQFTYIEKTALDAAFNPNWWAEWSIPQDKHDEFKKYFIALNKKIFKCNKTKALKNFDWFMKFHGLTIKN